jgi:hypothetical protein
VKTSVERQIDGVAVRVEYDEDKFQLYLDGREVAYGYVSRHYRVEVVDGVMPEGTTRFVEENAVFNEPAVVEQELAEAEENGFFDVQDLQDAQDVQH